MMPQEEAYLESWPGITGDGGEMNHRERVLMALHHQEPDRVPIDLGGTDVSSIMIKPYSDLRQHLGLGLGVLQMPDVYQQIVTTEEDLRRVFDTDTLFVFHEPREWKKATLSDGILVSVPTRFQPKLEADGSQVLFNPSGNAVAKMPLGGLYFDPIYSPLADATSVDDIERHLEDIENYETPFFLDKSYEQLAEKARDLREKSDYLLVGFFGGHIFQAAQYLRGFTGFLMDLVANPKFAEALMDRLAEANIRRFDRFAATIGPYIDIVEFEDDLGMQDRPMISPALYRARVKPYHERLYGYIKTHCDSLLFLHSDGAIAPFIPDFIEMGIDVLNPIQVSAAGMDTKALKQAYGKEIAFWGAGCDSQAVLPFGTPEEVADEVKRRIDDLAPGGGYVFAPIHNIQEGVPPQNIVALLKTARDYGVY